MNKEEKLPPVLPAPVDFEDTKHGLAYIACGFYERLLNLAADVLHDVALAQPTRTSQSSKT